MIWPECLTSNAKDDDDRFIFSQPRCPRVPIHCKKKIHWIYHEIKSQPQLNYNMCCALALHITISRLHNDCALSSNLCKSCLLCLSRGFSMVTLCPHEYDILVVRGGHLEGPHVFGFLIHALPSEIWYQTYGASLHGDNDCVSTIYFQWLWKHVKL